jgi:hypothetical protein
MDVKQNRTLLSTVGDTDYAEQKKVEKTKILIFFNPSSPNIKRYKLRGTGDIAI